jgi:uncharacterized protein YkwD
MRRRVAAVAIALLILFLNGSQALGDAGIDSGTNAYRIQNGRPALATWLPLQTVADMRVIEISTVFDHVTNWQRLFDLLPNCLSALGENIGFRTSPADSMWFVNAWIASPEHAANMLGWGWDWQASAIYVAPDGRTYGVQLFADGCTTSPPVPVPVTIPNTALPRS